MIGLVVAGEVVYLLPFHITRFFRPTVLDVFGLTNTQLGAVQGAYGIVAMVSYFLGGPLADRFSVRTLLAVSLWGTALVGLYLATMPGYAGAIVVWALFGVTTILLFWAALIRATREWGDTDEQGLAYGLLDSGRGVVSAGMATAAAMLFGLVLPDTFDTATAAVRAAALRQVIVGYSVITALSGVFVWWALAERGDGKERHFEKWRPDQERLSTHLLRALRLPAVWLIALIVVCAYVAYKGYDNYSLYAVEVLGLSPVEASKLAAIGAWMRPVAALGAGLLGDRYQVSRMTVLCFALLLVSQSFLALYTPSAAWVLLGDILATGAAMFGLRSLYYAVFEEARIPGAVMGTAVGIVSVIGYTPDVFVAYVGGVLLDRAPGPIGHRHYFLFLAAFAALGLLASLALVRMLHGSAREGAAPLSRQQ